MSDMMLLMLVGLGGELLLIVFIALVVSWVRNRAARRRDAKAMQALVARVKQGKAEREALLGKFLSEQMGLAGEVLDEARVTMLRGELGLLQRFVHLYGKRDAARASRFDTDLEAAIQPYHALAIAGDPIVEAEAGEGDGSELERLRAENSRLSDELRITMETMGRILNEYSTMFAGEAPADSPAAGMDAGDMAGDDVPESEAVVVSEENGGDHGAGSVPEAAAEETGAAGEDGPDPASDLVGAEPADDAPGVARSAADAEEPALSGEAEDADDPDAADIALMVPEEAESATAEAAAEDPAGDQEMVLQEAATTASASKSTGDDDLSAVSDLLAEVDEAGGGSAGRQDDPPLAGPEKDARSDAGTPEDAPAVSGLNEADDFGDVSVMLEAEDIEGMDRDELDGIPEDKAVEEVDEALFDGFDEALTAAEEAADEARVPASQKA